MLLRTTNAEVIETLMNSLSRGIEGDEMKWSDVKLRTCQLYQEARRPEHEDEPVNVLYVTAEDMAERRSVVDIVRDRGCEVVVVENAIATRLEGPQVDLKRCNVF